MALILCPYHGARAARAGAKGSGAGGQRLCAACEAESHGREAAPLDSFRPVFPLLDAPRAENPSSGGAAISAVVIETSPAQTLAFTTTGVPVTLEELLPLIPRHIESLEAALAANNIIPVGPLTLLYDHPDRSDFSHYIVEFAYPVSATTRLAVPAMAGLPGVAARRLPPMRVASVTFHGPWTGFPAVYSVLRQFIKDAKLPLGPFTRECYVVPHGPYDARSITTIQRQLAGDEEPAGGAA